GSTAISGPAKGLPTPTPRKQSKEPNWRARLLLPERPPTGILGLTAQIGEDSKDRQTSRTLVSCTVREFATMGLLHIGGMNELYERRFHLRVSQLLRQK